VAKNNGELTALRKIAALIVIGTVFVGPYLMHDRAISKLQTDITYIKERVKEINNKIDLPYVANSDEKL